MDFTDFMMTRSSTYDASGGSGATGNANVSSGANRSSSTGRSRSTGRAGPRRNGDDGTHRHSNNNGGGNSRTNGSRFTRPDPTYPSSVISNNNNMIVDDSDFRVGYRSTSSRVLQSQHQPGLGSNVAGTTRNTKSTTHDYTQQRSLTSSGTGQQRHQRTSSSPDVYTSLADSSTTFGDSDYDNDNDDDAMAEYMASKRRADADLAAQDARNHGMAVLAQAERAQSRGRPNNNTNNNRSTSNSSGRPADYDYEARRQRDQRRAYYDQYQNHHQSSSSSSYKDGNNANNEGRTNNVHKSRVYAAASAGGSRRIGMDGSVSGSVSSSTSGSDASSTTSDSRYPNKRRSRTTTSLGKEVMYDHTRLPSKRNGMNDSRDGRRCPSFVGFLCCLLVLGGAGVGGYFAYKKISEKDNDQDKSFAALNSSPTTAGMWDGATCPSVGRIYDNRKSLLAIRMSGLSSTVDDVQTKRKVEQAIKDGYNLVSQMGCNDVMYSRWMYNVKLINQTVVQDLDMIQGGDDVDVNKFSNFQVGFEYSPALLAVFETDISCMGCSDTDAFSSYYPTTFGGPEGVDGESDGTSSVNSGITGMESDLNRGGRRKLLHHLLQTSDEITGQDDEEDEDSLMGLYRSTRVDRNSGGRSSKYGRNKARGTNGGSAKGPSRRYDGSNAEGGDDVVHPPTTVHALPQPWPTEYSFESDPNQQSFVHRSLQDFLNAAIIIQNMESQMIQVLDITGFSDVMITSISIDGEVPVSQMRQAGGGKGKGGGAKGFKGEAPSMMPSISDAPTMTPFPTTKSGKTAAKKGKGKGAKNKGGVKGQKGKKSAAPSQVPSISPSMVPSQLPSISPSVMPSLSAAPSLTPSISPSQVPSSTPSELPSQIPSALPSQVPSNVPSSEPSQVPSNVPSLTPSATPSMMPSIQLCQIDAAPGVPGFILEQAVRQNFCIEIDPLVILGVTSARCQASAAENPPLAYEITVPGLTNRFCCGTGWASVAEIAAACPTTNSDPANNISVFLNTGGGTETRFCAT